MPTPRYSVPHKSPCGFAQKVGVLYKKPLRPICVKNPFCTKNLSEKEGWGSGVLTLANAPLSRLTARSARRLIACLSSLLHRLDSLLPGHQRCGLDLAHRSSRRDGHGDRRCLYVARGLYDNDGVILPKGNQESWMVMPSCSYAGLAASMRFWGF